MNVGENIRGLRERRRMKQEDLANEVGITQAMLSQIERGTKNPSLQVSKLIADVLGCNIEEFFE